MITITEHNGRRLVSSLEVYKKAGYNPTKYARWFRVNLCDMGQKGIDYFDITEKEHQNKFFPKAWHHKTRISPELYFLTIETAITVCFMAKTESAKKLKLFLQLHK